MQLLDSLYVLYWWFYLLIMGIVFFPIIVRIFPQFFDRGYIFAKIIGIAIISYITLLLGITHIAPFTRLTTFAILGSLACLTILLPLITKRREKILDRALFKIVFVEECLFLGGLFFLSYIRAFAPEIHGLEKYMDYGFINSILRARFFPPVDMWFPPSPINYYYFGHLTTAVLTKLSNIPPFITYNLMLATIFAFCFTGSFSIGANLYNSLMKEKVSGLKRFFTGLLTALLVALAGNLHVIYTLFKPYENEHPLPLWKLAFSPLTFPNSYWYPNATRFIHNTIHEFPIYSWVVSDLHGHVLSIPFVLTIIAVLLSIFLIQQSAGNQSETKVKKSRVSRINILGLGHIEFYDLANKSILLYFLTRHKNILGSIFITSFLLSVMYMTNAWDGIIYLLLTGLVFATILALQFGKKYHVTNRKAALQHIFFNTDYLLQLAYRMVPVFLGFLLFSLPFSMFFKPFVSGIGVLCAPKSLTDIGQLGPLLFEADHCEHSPWWQLLTLYGFFSFFVITFVLFLSRRKKIVLSDIFVLILSVLSIVLIIIPEFIYIKDIYPAHYRANTMFKLVFQSFMMLSIVSGYIIARIFAAMRERPGINRYTPFAVVTVILFVAVMTYPYLAINAYYNNVLVFQIVTNPENPEESNTQPTPPYKGLNGITYLKEQYPSDYEAILWLNKNITGQPVILEAQGDSYTDYARVSANTGLPTVLGWTVHEWLWRGTYDIPAPRIGDVQKMYEEKDLQATRDLLKKYNVSYIFMGDLERQKYTDLEEGKFNNLGKIIYQNGNTKIYKL